MKCYFNKQGNPCVDLKVIGARGTANVTAAIDTGFDGSFALSEEHFKSIKLANAGTATVTGWDDDTKSTSLHSGTVVLNKKRVPLENILLTKGQSLLGIGLLQDQKLTIDFPKRTVIMVPSQKQNKNP